MGTRGTLALFGWCARPVEVGWLAAAVAVPLALNPWSCNSFELPKSLLLVTIVLLMGLAALVRAGERADRLERPPASMLWPALALGLALALATAFSTNPRISLWGSYGRQQGLLTLGAYLALFFLTAIWLRTRAQADRLLSALVWASAPVVAYGLFQAAAYDPLGWQTDAASPVLSTIGRANFLGSYLVLILPLTAGKALLARRRWPYLLLGVSQLACLALTQARGAWMGMSVAALTFGLAWAAATRDRRLALLVVAAAILAVGLVASLSVVGLPGLERVAALARTDEGSAAARLTIWRATLPMVATRPWLGYGPETMETAFASVFPPQLVYYQGRGLVVDRAHNLWLDMGMSAGLAGIAAFAALLLGFGRSAWRGLRGAVDRWDRVIWAALAAAVLGHLVDMQFSFDLTASATVFWLILGVGAAAGRGLDSSELSGSAFSKPKVLLPYLLPAIAILALMGAVCVRPLLADCACWRAQREPSSLQERLAQGRQAVSLWPLEPEYRGRLSWLHLRGGDFAAAEAQLAAAARLSPENSYIWAAWGELYARWGELESGRHLQAEAAYRRAVDLAPNVATHHASLGMVLARQGRLEEGAAELKRAVELDATDGAAYGYLAGLYRELGWDSEAEWAWREAVIWGGEQEG